MERLESKEKKEERMNLIAGYMKSQRPRLTEKIPVIAMLNIMDIKTLKKHLKAPFDNVLLEALEETGKHLCKKIQECKMGYIHSGLNEISLLISDLEASDTWLNYDIQKVISFISGTASTFFNDIFAKIVLEKKESGLISLAEYEKYLNKPMILFNVKVFNVNAEDVPEYFISKQYESINYSMQNFRKFYVKNSSSKGKTLEDMELELLDKNIVWDDILNYYKYGVAIERVEVNVGDGIRHYWISNRDVSLYLKNTSYFNKFFI